MNAASDRLASLAAAVLMLVGATWLVGCTAGGGGFEGDGEGTGIQAGFAAAEPAPGAPAVAMAAGEASGAAFDVEIRVQELEGLFGAAFRVGFDSRFLSFAGFSSAGSLLLEPDVATEFRAQLAPGDPETLIVSATRRGQVAGIGTTDSALLLTLNFELAGPTTGSEIRFGPESTRRVTTCPEPPDACRDVPDAELAWTGGRAVGN